MKNIKIITTLFDAPLSDNENEYLRGAVIHKLSDIGNVLMHNHLDRKGSLRYDYPLVQYKNLNGKAAIVCLEEGTRIIEELISGCDLSFTIGTRPVQMHIQELIPAFFTPQISEQGFHYRITRWQALNSENYQTYRKLTALTDKILFLEKIMTGHILALYRGLGIHVDAPLTCKFIQMESPRIDKYKEIKTTVFNAVFTSNIALPVYAGLGKGASIGFGTIGIGSVNCNSQDFI